MRNFISELELKFGSVGNVSTRSIFDTLLVFRRKGNLPKYSDIKYACFGLCQPIEIDNWRIIENRKAFDILISELIKITKMPQQFKKCYQGLLNGYFVYPVLSEQNINYKQNWAVLRNFLRNNMDILFTTKSKSKWAEILKEHSNLLDDKPCVRYAIDLLNERYDEFNYVCEGLSIPSESWVRELAVMSQIKAGCNISSETEFKSRLSQMINVALGKSPINISNRVSISCTAKLLIRYSNCDVRPEHVQLRDLALLKVGNPWIKRSMWDAHVRDENARKMIDSWLKKDLITDFFNLLAEDGTADQRRLNYWLRYERNIDDMWFALGPYANNHSDIKFKEMKKKAQGRLLSLDHGGNDTNNAFIMRMGKYLFVEFGVKGNACFVFDSGNIPFNLEKSSIRGDDYDLKSKKHIARETHTDRPSAGQSWEEKFDSNFFSLIQFKPESSPYSFAPRKTLTKKHTSATRKSLTKKNTSERKNPKENNISFLSILAKVYGFKMIDNRSKGGALWVMINDSNEYLSKQLKGMGFNYFPDKGWWTK